MGDSILLCVFILQECRFEVVVVAVVVEEVDFGVIQGVADVVGVSADEEAEDGVDSAGVVDMTNLRSL